MSAMSTHVKKFSRKKNNLISDWLVLLANNLMINISMAEAEEILFVRQF